jgi:2-polyprenyl-6-methoxyphenol hydroxylase-like FAD-dependent oxidoreductase
MRFTIFERDENAEARAQGFRPKIFPASVPNLQYLTPPDVFAELEAISAETFTVESVIGAISGEVTARRALRGPKPYTVDRGLLRKVLLRGLEGHIRWGKDALRYVIEEANPKSPVTVHFADGSSASRSLLVCADGNHSRLRKQLVPHHQVFDADSICLFGRT